MTPKEYIEYLLDLSEKNQVALEVAKNFEELSKKEQEAYLEFMYSEDYHNVLTKAISGSELDKTYKVNCVEIPVSTTVEDKSSLSSIGVMATWRAEATAHISLQLFGFTTSSLSSTLTWQHNGSNALQIYSVSQYHSNYNPALWITDKGTQHNGISSGKAYGISNFELRATGSAGFISYSVKNEVRGRILSDTQHKMTTKHPMGGFGWANF